MPYLEQRWTPCGRVIIAALALSLITFSCSKERPLAPTPTRYRLYVSVNHDPGAAIVVIDATSDSVIDTITGFTDVSSGYIKASPDGKYIGIYQIFREVPVVIDVSTHGVIAHLSSAVNDLLFMPDEGLLLGLCADSTLVYSIPTFDLKEVWPVELSLCRRIPKSTRLIGIDYPPPPGFVDPGKVVLFDFRTKAIVDSFYITERLDRPAFIVLDLEMFPDARTMVVLGPDSHATWVIRFDFIDKRVVFKSPLEFGGHLAVSPDGSEVWVTVTSPEINNDPPLPPLLGYVLVMDAASGTPVDTIKTAGLRINRPGVPMPILDVRFHPDLPKVYVDAYRSTPALLVIDSKTRRVTRTLLNEHPHQSVSLDIAPY